MVLDIIDFCQQSYFHGDVLRLQAAMNMQLKEFPKI